MGVFVEVVDGRHAARWAPDLERDRLGVELVEDLARGATTERTAVNAEDAVQSVYDESRQRDDSCDREHQPETPQKPLFLGALRGDLVALAAGGTLLL